MAERLDSRAADLLKLLVERYVQDGQPVGSRTLARAGHMNLSPATIRNVMADLDEAGFVRSPHTSAGRVPTQLGYRYFIDSLLTPEPLSERDVQRIARELLRHGGPTCDLAEITSALLSQLSGMAAVVTVPKRNRATLRRIEFLPLSERRVLAILVVNHAEVQNRVISTAREYSAAELERYANAINEHFAGLDLPTLRNRLRADALAAQSHVHQHLREAAKVAAWALGDDSEEDYVLAGGSNLLAYQELTDVKRLRELFEALDRKREMLALFEQCLQASGVQIFIGEESGYQVLDECSVVTAPYFIDGQVAGVLGVIGPTRMAYHRIIPLVAETALALATGLKAGS
ncbi:MAG: heat-inducible transcription repressor HrcA [Gammaproteobacteria bacterium]|nr:heat-inducible transcription repressor HrcA [Gammaproteobacteria bacterium]